MKKIHPLLFLLLSCSVFSQSSHSAAREWNEILLTGIRGDFARPTVHARNLFHSSIILYDAWALFDDTSQTVFLGKEYQDYFCDFEGLEFSGDAEEARSAVMSYGMYRLLLHRFADSPGFMELRSAAEGYMVELGLDLNFTSTDYREGSAAALGNYLAEQIIAFGLADGSNEDVSYNNVFYFPVNDPLILESSQTVNEMNDPNRWQPLAFDVFVDQSGNVLPNNIPDFLSPEWGVVKPFALKETDLEILNNGFDSYIYRDPGAPPSIQNSTANGIEDPYKWNFAMVAAWSAHLDPNDPTEIDISPGSIGNVSPENYPDSFEEYQNFYRFAEGGDIGQGHDLNPVTNAPYAPQMVKRSDYARVLAEFWADGPDSETPPGHWFTILNYVSDHPQTVKRIKGSGELVSDLEWDVKAYLAMGGAMHDAAVTTWGVKGYYDYIRPVSAIRYMARGQSSDPALPSFDPHGLPLIPGLIELIEAGDPLAGASDENVGRLKLYTWRGPDFIGDPEVDAAGVGWIFATDWWPYQRPSFVTPPFAGYVSGHSTFSSAAAEVLTLFTGDAFFPGGMGVFDVVQNEFLVFEEGPTSSFSLQWATYRDASDQTSLSRIWGGIHPPVDDIPGRKLGLAIGTDAFALADRYFEGLEDIPADNFLVQTQAESCTGSANGRLVVTANEFRNYRARIGNQEYTFTESLTIEPLAAGTYELCLSIDGNAEFERCFGVVLPEGQGLNAGSKESPDGKRLFLEVFSGTPPFVVKLDNEILGEFDGFSYEMERPSSGVLTLTSKLPCEGIFSRFLSPTDRGYVFPNPVLLETTVFANAPDGWVKYQLYNTAGQVVKTSEVYCREKRFDLVVEELPAGLYFLQLDNSTKTTYRILKQ
jgi:hypothetical protein